MSPETGNKNGTLSTAGFNSPNPHTFVTEVTQFSKVNSLNKEVSPRRPVFIKDKNTTISGEDLKKIKSSMDSLPTERVEISSQNDKPKLILNVTENTNLKI